MAQGQVKIKHNALETHDQYACSPLRDSGASKHKRTVRKQVDFFQTVINIVTSTKLAEDSLTNSFISVFD